MNNNSLLLLEGTTAAYLTVDIDDVVPSTFEAAKTLLLRRLDEVAKLGVLTEIPTAYLVKSHTYLCGFSHQGKHCFWGSSKKEIDDLNSEDKSGFVDYSTLDN